MLHLEEKWGELQSRSGRVSAENETPVIQPVASYLTERSVLYEMCVNKNRPVLFHTSSILLWCWVAVIFITRMILGSKTVPETLLYGKHRWCQLWRYVKKVITHWSFTHKLCPLFTETHFVSPVSDVTVRVYTFLITYLGNHWSAMSHHHCRSLELQPRGLTRIHLEHSWNLSRYYGSHYQDFATSRFIEQGHGHIEHISLDIQFHIPSSTHRAFQNTVHHRFSENSTARRGLYLLLSLFNDDFSTA